MFKVKTECTTIIFILSIGLFFVFGVVCLLNIVQIWKQCKNYEMHLTLIKNYFDGVMIELEIGEGDGIL